MVSFSDIEEVQHVCAIHLDVVECPKVLPCGHVFCLECLHKHIIHSGSIAEQSACATFTCPLCRNTSAARLAYKHTLEDISFPQLNKSQCSPELVDGQDKYPFKDPTIVPFRRTYSCRRVERGFLSITSEQNYEAFRESANMQNEMSHKGRYEGICHGLACCQLPKPFATNVSMQYLKSRNTDDMIRCVIGVDTPNRCLYMYSNKSQLINHSQRRRVDMKRVRQRDLQEFCHPLDFDEDTQIIVRYVLVLSNRIYLSIEMYQSEDSSSKKGMLLCYENPEIENTGDEISLSSDFVLLSKSEKILCPENLDLDIPIVQGVYVNTQERSVYLCSPINSYIYKFDMDDLEKMLYGWCLFSPQMHPSYVCYDEEEKILWASCINERSLVRLDTSDNHYSYTDMFEKFSVVPKDIIITTDRRVILLDSSRSELLWIKSVNENLYLSKLNLGLAFVDSCPIQEIKAMEDNETKSRSRYSGRVRLSGGILCCNDSYCYVVYPREYLKTTSPLLSPFRKTGIKSFFR